jgi:hypothetical protein
MRSACPLHRISGEYGIDGLMGVPVGPLPGSSRSIRGDLDAPTGSPQELADAVQVPSSPNDEGFGARTSVPAPVLAPRWISVCAACAIVCEPRRGRPRDQRVLAEEGANVAMREAP